MQSDLPDGGEQTGRYDPAEQRKTFASRLAAEGIPPRIITELLGHEDYHY